MCTLAWGETSEGLWVCFNRDEQRTRSLADPPRLYQGTHHPLVYAKDTKGGGTWFAVSAGGFAVALLNRYPKEIEFEKPGTRSRGRLVLDLIDAPSAEAAFDRFGEEDLSPYAPFFLFILSADAVRASAWDGSALSFPIIPEAFWTTSSHEATAVIDWRNQWWSEKCQQGIEKAASVSHLLRSTHPERPAYGATMDRKDARTVNQIELMLEPGQITFSYRVREPDGLGYEPPLMVSYP